MSKKLSAAEMKYIIYRVLKNGYESTNDEKNKPTDINKGRSLAYWEVLDTIYNRLEICEQNPNDFGYPDNWEKLFWVK
ncbi:MAG: hypothetical protein IJT57_01875 [Selenomonadaceae bacterium]|nr:hypothetical protein [Selenomonadaceae bacterium]MBQ7723048.1 hypothetical protein [Selenomonadaceae bacterium]